MSVEVSSHMSNLIYFLIAALIYTTQEQGLDKWPMQSKLAQERSYYYTPHKGFNKNASVNPDAQQNRYDNTTLHNTMDVAAILHEKFSSETSRILKLLPIIKKVSTTGTLQKFKNALHDLNIQLSWPAINGALLFEATTGLPYLFQGMQKGQARNLLDQVTGYIRSQDGKSQKIYKDVFNKDILRIYRDLVLEKLQKCICEIANEPLAKSNPLYQAKTECFTAPYYGYLEKSGWPNDFPTGNYLIYNYLSRELMRKVSLPQECVKRWRTIQVSHDMQYIALSNAGIILIINCETSNIIKRFENLSSKAVMLDWLPNSENILISNASEAR